MISTKHAKIHWCRAVPLYDTGALWIVTRSIVSLYVIVPID